MESKTNALRILDKHKIKYLCHTYDAEVASTGEKIAAVLGENPAQVFKTLVTVAKSKQHYIFMIPVALELNLKKAAAAVGEKNLEMIKQKELLPLTGYIHGGCSPIGMKKNFPTYIDQSAQNFDIIFFSAGRVGLQVETNLTDLIKVAGVSMADLTD